MIITLKKNAPKHDVDKLIDKFEGMNLHVTMIQGDNYNVFGLVGDTSVVDEKSVMANPIVYNVQRVAQPYKLTNRMFHPEDTIVDVNGIQIGGKKIAMIAGPCSVEGEDQICRIAKEVKAAGADMLRGGAYKPRTSPYAFQGMGKSVRRAKPMRPMPVSALRWMCTLPPAATAASLRARACARE